MIAFLNRWVAWVLWRLMFRLLVMLSRSAVRHAPGMGALMVKAASATWTMFQKRFLAPQALTGLAHSPASYCGQCGERRVSDVEFCSRCGLLASDSLDLASWLTGPVLPLAITGGLWGATWLGLSLMMARGLRQAQPWARTATVAIALLWTLTGVGGLFAIPLIVALLLPSTNAYFDRSRFAGGRSASPSSFALSRSRRP